VLVSKQYKINENVVFLQVFDCKITDISVLFIVAFSHFTLMALTLDRYIFISRPLHYPLIMTTSRTWIIMVIVASWATGFAVTGALVFQVS
jgi:hypothetical protein